MSSRSGLVRIVAGSLLTWVFVAEAGCSSSASPPNAGGDSGSPSGDAGLLDSTMPGSDAADGLLDSPEDQEPTTEAAGSEAGPEAAALPDCTSDEASDGLPNDLFCTGLYSDWASKTVAAINVAFTPGYVLWSDNANKARYMYLPPGTQIDTTDMDNWVFPVGTKVWKEFALGPLRVETRIFEKTAGGWLWATYRWTADGESGATRLDTGETNVNGTSYEIPSHGQCQQCHGGRPDKLLGFDVINLGASTAVGMSLGSLIDANVFTTNPPRSVEIPEDRTGHARASLGWLHSNCGVACHNSNPAALAYGTGLFLKTSGAQIIAGGGTTKTSDLDPYVTAVGVAPNMQLFATEGFRRIVPGHPEISLIPTLDGSRNNPSVPQMPPIVSHIADTRDVQALVTWIASMPVPDAGAIDAGSPDAASTDAAAPDAGPPDSGQD
jgi:hypothetical protein